MRKIAISIVYMLLIGSFFVVAPNMVSADSVDGDYTYTVHNGMVNITGHNGAVLYMGYVANLIANASSGSTVNIPAGEYYEEATIYIDTDSKNNLTISGAGKTATILHFNAQEGFSVYGAGTITFQNLSITDSYASDQPYFPYALFTYNTRIICNNVKFYDIPVSLFILYGNNHQITNCDFINNVDDGICCYDADNVVVDSCYFNGTISGIEMLIEEHFQNWQIKNCTFTGNCWTAIRMLNAVTQTVPVYFSNITLDNCKMVGFSTMGDVTITNSVFSKGNTTPENGDYEIHQGHTIIKNSRFENTPTIDPYCGTLATIEYCSGNYVCVTPGRLNIIKSDSNLPPNKPRTPSGPIQGKSGVEYVYTSSITDPEADQVYCLWNWGDGNTSGWLGPYDSGATCDAKHTWIVKDNYNIKVKAKDIYGKESAWSDSLPITMPYSYNPILHFFELLFQRLPNAFPLLRQLMEY